MIHFFENTIRIWRYGHQKLEMTVLYLKCEDGNEHNKYSKDVMIGERASANVPKNLSKTFDLFLPLPNSAIKCKVTGKRINGAAGY